MNKNIEKAYDFTKNVIIVGDLNEDLLNPNFHNLKDLLLLNSLENVIIEPTRQQAILDPIIISDDLSFFRFWHYYHPSTISDHKATFIRIPFQYQCQSKKISNDQELIQSDPISCPQNQKGNN